MNILLTHCHSDCTYSLLKVLEKIDDLNIYIPTKPVRGLTSHSLDYNEWPIKNFKNIIHPLEDLGSLNEIDHFIAEIINISFLPNGEVTDSQVEWGVQNLGIEKVIAYCYNVIGFDKFKYRDQIPLVSTSKISYNTYGSAPKHFFHGEAPIFTFFVSDK